MSELKLFAVYLGGRAPKANTELHDVVFAAGATIEDTYPQLLEKWFGSPEGLHIDSWLELDVVDGWRISLSPQPSPAREALAGEVAGRSDKNGEASFAPTASESRRGPKLFFVNLGGYDHRFTELHDCGFFIAPDAAAAKTRALAELLKGARTRHKDDLYCIDTCIALGQVDGLAVTLIRTDEVSTSRPNNGYHPIAKAVIAAYRMRTTQP